MLTLGLLKMRPTLRWLFSVYILLFSSLPKKNSLKSVMYLSILGGTSSQCMLYRSLLINRGLAEPCYTFEVLEYLHLSGSVKIYRIGNNI